MPGAGKVEEATIDDAIRGVLRVKFELGLFNDSYRYCDEGHEAETIGRQCVWEGALNVARKSIVLLKNKNELLPLPKSGRRMVIIDALADDRTSALGSWRGAFEDGTAVSVLEGLSSKGSHDVTHRRPRPRRRSSSTASSSRWLTRKTSP